MITYRYSYQLHGCDHIATMDEYILTAIVMVQYMSAYATLTWQFENWKQRMSICNSLFPFTNVVRTGMDAVTPIDLLIT